MAYTGGIYNAGVVTCNPASLNHTVLLIGYGVDNGTDYFLLKNSWSSSWGEAGYMRIQNTGSNSYGICGINI